jgi:hypothetical protein
MNKLYIKRTLLSELYSLDQNGWAIATDGSLEEVGDIDAQIYSLTETIANIYADNGIDVCIEEDREGTVRVYFDAMITGNLQLSGLYYQSGQGYEIELNETEEISDEAFDGYEESIKEACASKLYNKAILEMLPSMKYSEAKPLEWMQWEELKAFRLILHSDDLTVTTNAPESVFEDAINSFSKYLEYGKAKTIEAILREMGYVATAGKTTKTFSV